MPRTNCWAGRGLCSAMKPVLSVLLLATLAACATPSAEPRIVVAAAETLEPVDVPVSYVERTFTGPRFNAEGGEIPRAAPTGEVEEGGLEDVPSS